MQRLLDVTLATLELAFDLMHTKSRWSQVAREMDQYVRDNGYRTVECFVGHGIGRDMHEDPQVPNFLSRGLRGSGDFPPRAGAGDRGRADGQHGHQAGETALATSGPSRRLDGKPSAHFEHTIAITRDGPVGLTAAPTPAELPPGDLGRAAAPELRREPIGSCRGLWANPPWRAAGRRAWPGGQILCREPLSRTRPPRRILNRFPPFAGLGPAGSSRKSVVSFRRASLAMKVRRQRQAYLR